MPSIKRTMAACAAVASIATVGASPAQADTTAVDPNPCTMSLPDCTDYVFDTARGGVETGRTTWNTGWAAVDNGACGAYEFVTDEECPSAAKMIMAAGYL